MQGFKTGTKTFRDHSGAARNKPVNEEVTWRVSAYALITVGGTDILMVEQVVAPGLWMLPGGEIRPTESIPDGLVRQCQEELGTQIDIQGQTPRFLYERDFYAEWVKAFYHLLVMVYAAQVSPAYLECSAWASPVPNEIAKIDCVPLSRLAEASCHPVVWRALSQLSRQSAP